MADCSLPARRDKSVISALQARTRGAEKRPVRWSFLYSKPVFVCFGSGLLITIAMMSGNVRYKRHLVVAVATFTLVFFVEQPVRADQVTFAYEGDILPSDPSSGFLASVDPCQHPCSESIQDGFLTWSWAGGGTFRWLPSENCAIPERSATLTVLGGMALRIQLSAWPNRLHQRWRY